MYYASLDDEDRIVSYDSMETKTHKIPFDDPEHIVPNAEYKNRDFKVSNGKVSLNPLPETLERLEKEQAERDFIENGASVQAEQDDAICALFEENIELTTRANDIDDAICSLFEMMLEV